MNRFYDTISNPRGDILPNHRVRVLSSTDTTVSIFSDAGGTNFPIANTCVVDANGFASFFWEAAAGQKLEIQDSGGNRVFLIERFADNQDLANTFGTLPDAAVPGVANKANASAIGVAGSAANMGAFTSALIDDNVTAKAAIESIGTNLAGNAGANFVAFKRAGADAVLRQMGEKISTEIVSIADWGVEPTDVYIPGTGAKINAAIEQAPLGSTLRFHGQYFTEVPIVQRRGVNIHFEAGAGVVGIFDDDTMDVWSIAIEEMPFGAGEARQLRFDNFRVACAATLAARDTLRIENVSPLVGNLQCLFVNPTIIAQPDAAGYAVRFKGLVTQMHTFINHFISGGVLMDGCADASRFLYGQIDGVQTAFTVDLAGGAFKTEIIGNVLTCRDGAMTVLGGSQIDFHYNQIEQVASRGANQNDHSASIIITTDSYGSRGISIEGNNMGGAEFVDYSLYVKSSGDKTVEDLVVGKLNTWSKTEVADIAIADDGVKYTSIDLRQGLRGERGTGGYDVYPDAYDANTDDVGSLLNVADSGIGTAGVRKNAVALGGASATALQNGYTCPAAFYFSKDPVSGLVSFNGTFDGPAAAQNGVTFGTLPAGFRPDVDQIISVSGFDVGTGTTVDGFVLIQTSGAMLCQRPASTNTVRLGASPITFRAKREGYNPSY